jgi:hypothetical protein
MCPLFSKGIVANVIDLSFSLGDIVFSLVSPPRGPILYLYEFYLPSLEPIILGLFSCVCFSILTPINID